MIKIIYNHCFQCVCEKYQQKNNKVILKIYLTISKLLKSAVKSISLYIIKSKPKKTCTSLHPNTQDGQLNIVTHDAEFNFDRHPLTNHDKSCRLREKYMQDKTPILNP